MSCPLLDSVRLTPMAHMMTVNTQMIMRLECFYIRMEECILKEGGEDDGHCPPGPSGEPDSDVFRRLERSLN